MKHYIADQLSVGIDTVNRRVTLQWSNDALGPLVSASLTAEQVGQVRDALIDSLRQLQNVPPVEVKL